MPEIFINIRADEDDVKMVERMMREDFIDNRSAFIRRLIRQEWARRYNQVSPMIEATEHLEGSNLEGSTTPEDVEQTMTNVMSLVERIMRTFKNEE
ncbi:hypothetical protein C4588_04255 [Candidatus Parcubacteria bacterium]|jgi:hypothetical protein|nr:MAG: hypothetical protein C4588_04255 [Candidatus Parcubacteria bacterium]